jgi:hypothetical protein
LPARTRVGVEARDDPVQLVDRAAEALTILLREFRRLRADNGAEQTNRQTHRACDLGTAFPSLSQERREHLVP